VPGINLVLRIGDSPVKLMPSRERATRVTVFSPWTGGEDVNRVAVRQGRCSGGDRNGCSLPQPLGQLSTGQQVIDSRRASRIRQACRGCSGPVGGGAPSRTAGGTAR
jgi:hypothetical protein